MRRTTAFAAAVLVLTAGSIAIAQPAKQAEKPAAEPTLPGLTAEQMQACMDAMTPGEMHQHLAQGVGTWHGKMKMWMPGVEEPMESECVTTVREAMGGRFFLSETKGDMGPMGVFEGSGIYGYDNVGKEFQGVWYDVFGTGMATGTGELSSDGKTMTWSMTYNCPMRQGPVTMRHVERSTGKDSMVMELYAPDMVTGKETKMMEIKYTREGSASASATSGR